MALRESPDNARPDNTVSPVGNEGDREKQEPGSGKPIIRRGAGEANSDIDIGSVSNTIDLTGGRFETDPRNAGGAEALALEIVDDSGGTFDVTVQWLTDDNSVAIEHTPPALTNVTDLEANLIMRSDRFKLIVENNSSATQVHGTGNAH